MPSQPWRRAQQANGSRSPSERPPDGHTVTSPLPGRHLGMSAGGAALGAGGAAYGVWTSTRSAVGTVLLARRRPRRRRSSWPRKAVAAVAWSHPRRLVHELGLPVRGGGPTSQHTSRGIRESSVQTMGRRRRALRRRRTAECVCAWSQQAGWCRRARCVSVRPRWPLPGRSHRGRSAGMQPVAAWASGTVGWCYTAVSPNARTLPPFWSERAPERAQSWSCWASREWARPPCCAT